MLLSATPLAAKETVTNSDAWAASTKLLEEVYPICEESLQKYNEYHYAKFFSLKFPKDPKTAFIVMTICSAYNDGYLDRSMQIRNPQWKTKMPNLEFKGNE